jgi:hypothetical protein
MMDARRTRESTNRESSPRQNQLRRFRGFSDMLPYTMDFERFRSSVAKSESVPSHSSRHLLSCS